MSNSERAASEERDPFQEEIEAVVRKFDALKPEPKLYAELVALGLSQEPAVDPADYRRSLRRAGLRASRASEIKVILEAPDVAKQFAAQADCSVREALALARAEKRKRRKAAAGKDPKDTSADDTANKESEPPPYARLEAALKQLLELLGTERAWCLKRGFWLLRFTPVCRPESAPPA